MTRLAHVADEGFVFDANGREAELPFGAALRTDAVGGKAGQFLDGQLRLWV